MADRLLCFTADSRWLAAPLLGALRSVHPLDVASGAPQALDLLESRQPDLVLLDLDAEGLGWLALLRRTDAGRALPVIVASSRRSDDEAAAALQAGADDYVGKDCDPSELLARVRAVLRRHRERELRQLAAVKLGSITLDPSRHLCLVRGRSVQLRPREFELLEALMRKAGRMLTRSYLLENVWGMSGQADTRTIDVAVSRLRKALGVRAALWIETVERYGYRFRDPRVLGR